jgi:hypothetical protein
MSWNTELFLLHLVHFMWKLFNWYPSICFLKSKKFHFFKLKKRFQWSPQSLYKSRICHSSWFEIRWCQVCNALASNHIAVDILATVTGVCQFLKLLSFPLRWCYFRYIPKPMKKTSAVCCQARSGLQPQRYWEPAVFRLSWHRHLVCVFLYFWILKANIHEKCGKSKNESGNDFCSVAEHSDYLEADGLIPGKPGGKRFSLYV